ncbi:MAG TPA: hypothetical protein VF905_09020 [Nitrospirota bacterium]
MKKPSGAASFFALIKQGKPDKEYDEAAVRELESTFRAYLEIAESGGFTGDKLKEYLFWQGAIVGMMIQSKAYIKHLQAAAKAQGVELPKKEDQS